MDEYERKLSTNNPVLMAKTMSTLIEIIQEKLKDKSEFKKKELLELKYLKEKFINGDANAGVISGKALVYLIKCGALEVSSITSELVAMIPFAKNYRGMVMVLCDLLVMDLLLKTKPDKYVCPFNLLIPQHPLITILIQNSDAWVDILNYLRTLYQTDDNILIKNLNELFAPVYKYVMCDPFLKTPEYCRSKFLQFILNEGQCNHGLIINIIAWLQIYSHANQVSTSNILNDAIKASTVKNVNEVHQFVALWMFSLIHEMFLNKWDATEVLFTISKVIENIENFQYVNPALIILSKCIGIAPLTSLKDLLKLCLNMSNRGFINFTIKQCLKINLLNWILYPSILTNDCIDMVYELYNVLNATSDEIIDKNESVNYNHYVLLYQNTNQQLHFIIEVCKLLEDKEHLDMHIAHILKHADNSSFLFLKHIYIFIAGIFLCDYSEDIISKCLYLLLKYVSVNNEIASNILTLILYKLANTRDSKIHFELLKAIPKMGIVKENVQIILSTLHVLASSSAKMKTFTMYLFYELWCCDTRYYLYLQKLLIEDNPSDKANFVVTKAHILKELCKRKPELYGSELATHLSKILNTCKNDDGIASSLALEGLRYLCTGGVIDIVTAWETLAPSFETENRENVIQSFCNLLSEVPNLYTDAIKYDEMISDVVNKLWNYTTNYTNIEIVKAAYETLTYFNHEQVSRYFPEMYKDDAGDRDASADVLVLASGEWWLSMLKNGNYAHFECITKFISGWVRKEISEYGKGVYFMSENRAEPRDYYYLQIYSIVKALLKHIKLKV